MTPEELAAIRDRSAERSDGVVFYTSARQTEQDRRALLAEVDRLNKENDALAHDLVEARAELGEDPNARAWDEGYGTGRDDESQALDLKSTPNPYEVAP